MSDVKPEHQIKKRKDEERIRKNPRNAIALPIPGSITNPTNAAEVLVGAVNRVIDVYNKLAASITDDEIKTMGIKDRISALQKLSYIHTATKKIKMPNMTFIGINTNNKTAEDLEKANLLLLNDNEVEEE